MPDAISTGARWLLLIHQLPPTPSYLRVKIARRMQRIGAVAIKNTVYVLPANDNTLEDFQWTIGEIRAGGGEANLFEARVIEGMTDGEVERNVSSSGPPSGIAPPVHGCEAASDARQRRDAQESEKRAKLARLPDDVGGGTARPAPGYGGDAVTGRWSPSRSGRQ